LIGGALSPYSGTVSVPPADDVRETEMKSKKPFIPREPQNLSVRYGEIGISAVAAAMRYQGNDNGSREPAGSEPNRWLKDMVPEGA
jgi:hypothetical protein